MVEVGNTETAVRRLIAITASQQQTHRTVLDWLRVEYAIDKPTNNLQNLTALDSDSFIAEVKHIRGKKLPLTAAGLQALREEHARTIEPARSLAAERRADTITFLNALKAVATASRGWRCMASCSRTS